MRKRTFLSEGYVSPAKEREELDRRYHKIGISAVAAAVRYQGDNRNVQAGSEDQYETESAA